MSKYHYMPTYEKRAEEDFYKNGKSWQYKNEPEKFWKHSYRVHLSELDTDGMFINADCEQDALDYAIDIAEENKWMGLFIENPTEEEMESHMGGGNHCLVLSSDNISITKVD